MKIESSIDQNTLYASLEDESNKLDAVNFQVAKEKLYTLISDEKIRNLKLKLSSIVFIDSSGLSVLLFIYKALLEKEGKLILCGLQEQPKTLLEVTHLYQLFTIEDDA